MKYTRDDVKCSHCGGKLIPQKNNEHGGHYCTECGSMDKDAPPSTGGKTIKDLSRDFLAG